MATVTGQVSPRGHVSMTGLTSEANSVEKNNVQKGSDKVNIYAGHMGLQLEAGRPQRTNLARRRTWPDTINTFLLLVRHWNTRNNPIFIAC